MQKRGLVLLLGGLIGLSMWLGYRSPQRPEEHVENFSSYLPPQTSTAVQGSQTPQTPVAKSASQKRLPPISGENEFRARFPGAWEFLHNENQIHSIFGGRISGYPNSVDGATQFAKDMAPLLGAKPEEIDTTNPRIRATAVRQLYQLNQKYGGWPVYQAHVSIFFLKGTQDISMVNSQLASIDSARPAPSLSANEAAARIGQQQKYSVQQAHGPVAFVKDHVAYPSYVVIATTTDTHESWEMIVDGSTGEILHRHPRNPDEDKAW